MRLVRTDRVSRGASYVASRGDVARRHHRLVALQVLLQLAAANAADDVVPLVLGALQYVLGRKLADVGLRQVLPERILEFEIAGEIDRRRNHLEVLLDGGYAFLCVGLDDRRRRK